MLESIDGMEFETLALQTKGKLKGWSYFKLCRWNTIQE